MCEKRNQENRQLVAWTEKRSSYTCQETCFNWLTGGGTKSAKCSLYGITKSDVDGSVCSCDKTKGCIFGESISGTVSQKSANMCTYSAKNYLCS